ncbi:MAG: ATP-binding protein [candidate division KSB1 bacterium]|nr:ATP-binding protein [candidate division KSB1 bacterium]
MTRRAHKNDKAGLAKSANGRHDNLSYLQNLIDSVEDGLLVIDRHLRVLMANRNFLKRFAKTKSEVIEQPCYAVLRAGAKACILCGDGCPSRVAFDTGRAAETTAIIESDDGQKQIIHIHSSPVFDQSGQVYQAIEVIRDITENKRLEAQLAKTEKEAAIGRIAAGLAHEINNPMAAISTCVEGLQRRIADWKEVANGQREEIIEYLEIIKQSAYRCKAIAENLLNFASRAPFTPKPVDLHEVLRQVCLLLEADACRQNKMVHLLLHHPQPKLQADREQLAQLFFNLIKNALEASMPGDTILVTSKVEGNKVSVMVKDSGCGIPRENMDKIFEPFFTTKEPGKGTGLGLAICQGIARQHHATIRVESEVEVGSTFIVELPI